MPKDYSIPAGVRETPYPFRLDSVTKRTVHLNFPLLGAIFIRIDETAYPFGLNAVTNGKLF